MTYAQLFFVECPHCEQDFELVWGFPSRVETAQDITEDDVEPRTGTCPFCEQDSEFEFPGWQSHDDAG